MKIKTEIIKFLCTGILFVSCAGEKGAVVKSFLDDTFFVHPYVGSVMLSRYRFNEITFDSSIDKDSCIISGTFYHRNSKEYYSGTVFNKYDVLRGWPHVYIPSLHLDTIVKSGDIEIHIPAGKYDILVFAAGYQPLHLVFPFRSQTKYSMEFYFGSRPVY